MNKQAEYDARRTRVRIDVRVSQEQRKRFDALGGAKWLRTAIERGWRMRPDFGDASDVRKSYASSAPPTVEETIRGYLRIIGYTGVDVDAYLRGEPLYNHSVVTQSQADRLMADSPLTTDYGAKMRESIENAERLDRESRASRVIATMILMFLAIAFGVVLGAALAHRFWR